MSAVVVLSWDPDTGLLKYVGINGGAGGSVVEVTVSADAAALISDELESRDLPWSAELEADGAYVLLDASGGVHLELCSVKAVGTPNDPWFELKAKNSARRFKIPAVTAGIPDMRSAGYVQALEYLYAIELTPPGCWLGCEGGVESFLRIRRERAEAARRSTEANKRFVNPYTFVPFPDKIVRSAPAGHHLLDKGRPSGTFTVTWLFTTPFQAPEGAAGTVLLRLPGSSVKGAIRSVHEALAGGCLRVFEERFVPSYRDTATVRSAGWTLAVVSESTKDGQPLAVQLCDDVVWADARQLRRACGGALNTGSRVAIRDEDVPAEPNSLGRKELDADAHVSDNGDWVVLVTDKGTRSEEKNTYFLACGKLGPRTAGVTEPAWAAFRVAVAGADDLRRRQRVRQDASSDDRRPLRGVLFDKELIGRRRVTTGRLWPGDVVWVKAVPDAGSWLAEELSLAAIWRHPGWPTDSDPRAGQERSQAGSRVSQDLWACSDPDWLCPTCQVFGSADQNARDRADPAEQRAYAGHVRFGDAVSAEPVKLTPIRRAPMGAPRPGAGQFYLCVDDPSPARSRDHKPTREWGSDPDAEQPRRLRGRKFYWHADPTAQVPERHVARQHQEDKQLAVDRSIAPAGTTLVQRIAFDNLSPPELGGLLAAFEPQRVLGGPSAGKLRLHLGGGKPLGLGSCAALVGELRVWSASSRYGGGPEVVPDGDSYAGQFAADCAEHVRRTWPALAAVLSEDSVDVGHVWYPPGVYWTDRARNLKEFDEPFAFFTGTSGMFLQDKDPRALVPLPAPASGDQSLPIIRKADLE